MSNGNKKKRVNQGKGRKPAAAASPLGPSVMPSELSPIAIQRAVGLARTDQMAMPRPRARRTR